MEIQTDGPQGEASAEVTSEGGVPRVLNIGLTLTKDGEAEAELEAG